MSAKNFIKCEVFIDINFAEYVVIQDIDKEHAEIQIVYWLYYMIQSS